jgi:hypothetical protein
MGTIKENFLEKGLFNNLQSLLFSEEINWFFKKNQTNNDSYFFNHCFYNNNIPCSVFYEDYIIPILKKLEAISVIEVRANLLLKKEQRYQSNFHIDRPFKCKTAILYMNTCDGYTVLDEIKKDKIKCEENKILIFDSQLKHSGVSQTDVDRRIVINFNYF